MRVTTPKDVELARLAKALGHPARVAIIRLLLSDGDCVCGAIASMPEQTTQRR